MCRVSEANPCPVCDKSDWCLYAADGTAAICQRVESAKRCGEAGWLHRLADPTPAVKPTRTPHGKPAAGQKNWPALAATYAANLDGARRAELAASLGLTADALDALPLLGFNPSDTHGPCFTFPEVDAAGNVVGLLRRWEKLVRVGKGDQTNKASIGNRGLTLPAGWRDHPGPVFVVEGPTDVLALTAAGLCAIGRPSNAGGAKLLAALFRDLPPGRDLVAVGENDQKPDGKWPGREGARSVARSLAGLLPRPVRWTLPPGGAKAPARGGAARRTARRG
jgi:hypothetical protein